MGSFAKEHLTYYERVNGREKMRNLLDRRRALLLAVGSPVALVALRRHRMIVLLEPAGRRMLQTSA